MKYTIITLLCAASVMIYAGKNDQVPMLSITSQYSHPEKVALLLGTVGTIDEQHQEVIDHLAQHLALEHQQKSGFSVAIVPFEDVPSQKSMKLFFDQGYSLMVFVSQVNDALEWRLYDATEYRMLAGKKVSTASHSLHDTAEFIAGSLWEALLHENGLFGSKIAYCKEYKTNKGKRVRSICLQSACGIESEQLHVETPSMKCGLRWHPSADKSSLYYSECTNSNVRLMSVNAQKKRSMVANLDGLTMEPSFSLDGTKMVMSSSFRGKSHIYYGQRTNQNEPWTFRRLTHNEGNNISPILLQDGNVLFCSDFEHGRPHIYQYDIESNSVKKISSGLSSTSPSVCFARNKMSYSKVVEGVIQLFTYDFETEVHQQITYDAGDKEESSWSPCGNFLAFSYDTGSSCRVGILNLITKERWFITPRNQYCMHPAWSPGILNCQKNDLTVAA